MKTYAVISTFPKEGSKNIGDKLIEERTIDLIRHVKGDCLIENIWREDNIAEHVETINSSSALIFACLAIRREISPKIYNFPANLDQFKVPLIPLASGTSFRPQELVVDNLAARIEYDEGTVNFLREIARRTFAFSCRGEITYNYLRSIGVQNGVMTGDVAFFNPRFDSLKFEQKRGIRRIAVSTPHQPKIFAEQFYALVAGLRQAFPQAEVDIMVHGASDWIERDRLDARVLDIYLKPTDALDHYLEVDVHVGFRVHGHVSALTRRTPSYLLATDGRGYDYGHTLRTGTTWPAWRTVVANAKPNDTGAKGPRLITHAEMALVDYVVDFIRRDEDNGFNRFVGFENEIARFNRSLTSFVQQIP